MAVSRAQETIVGALPAGANAIGTVDTELPAAAALADSTANPTTPVVGAFGLIWNAGGSPSWNRARQAGDAQDGTGIQGVNAMVYDDGTSQYNVLRGAGVDAMTTKRAVAAGMMASNGSTLDRVRTPKTFKTITNASITAASPAAGWTPTSGKKFRLMCGQLSLSVAGQIILKDATTEILRSPQLAAGGVWSIDGLGNGILSTAANAVLNVDVSSTGSVGGWLGGTEE